MDTRSRFCYLKNGKKSDRAVQVRLQVCRSGESESRCHASIRSGTDAVIPI